MRLVSQSDVDFKQMLRLPREGDFDLAPSAALAMSDYEARPPSGFPLKRALRLLFGPFLEHRSSHCGVSVELP